MTALRDSIKSYLAADATLMALLPGGLHANANGIDRQETPTAFDANGEIKACGLVAMEVEAPAGPHETSGRAFFTVTFYERSGYAAIDAALERTFDLLHRGKAGVSSDLWEVRHADDSQDFVDPGLLCSSRFSRWVAWRRR